MKSWQGKIIMNCVYPIYFSENNLNVYCPPQKLRRLNDLYDDSSSENDETTEIIVIELVD